MSLGSIDGIDPQAYERFMYGDCWLLAERISRETGFPVVALSEDGDTPAEHAAVLTPDDRLLDVDGVHSMDEFFALYDHDEMEFELVDCPQDPGWRFDAPLDEEMLADTARRVIEHYKAN